MDLTGKLEEKRMKVYEVTLNGKQYFILEKMLCSVRARQLAGNQLII